MRDSYIDKLSIVYKIFYFQATDIAVVELENRGGKG